MRDSVEVFGVPLSQNTRPHGPPRPQGFSTQRAMSEMAADGETALKRTLLWTGSLVLGALAMGAAAGAATGEDAVDDPAPEHPP